MTSDRKNHPHSTELKSYNQISVYLSNARGILGEAQQNDLSQLLNSHHNLIAITETHLDNNIPDGLISQNYLWNVFRRDRNRYGGGVALLTKIPCKKRSDLQSTHGEDLWIEINANGQQIIVGVVYRPPYSTPEKIDLFITELEESLRKALSSKPILCLLGDFNAKSSMWLPGNVTDTPGLALYNLLESFQLTQLVADITRPPGGQGLPSPDGKGSLLDLIITNRPLLFEYPETLCPLGSSDHFSIQTFMKTVNKIPKRSLRRLWNLKKANIADFLTDLNNQHWPSKDSKNSIDTQWNQWLSTFTFVADRNIPSKILKSVTSKPPWLSDSLLAESKLKKNLFKLYKINPTEENHKIFRTQRNRVTALLRRAKKSFSSNLENQLHQPPTSRNFWSFIRQLRSNSSSNNLPTSLIKPDGTKATTNKEKADTLNTHFLSQSSTRNAQDPIYKICPPPLPTITLLDSVSLSPEDVFKQLTNLNPKKSPGLDQLPNNILSVAAPVICHSLAVLFKNSISQGKLPTAWKHSKIKAIFKKGRKECPDNYRPISLLSNVTKVLESLINRTLYNHLTSHQLISSSQSGFRHGDSAPLQLFRLSSELFSALDSGKVVAAVFYDFKKAFDSVWHKALLGKLYSAGVSGSLFLWLKDFLTSRLQQVEVEDSLSSVGSPEAGVPQGSPLSPTLFLLYINSVTSATTSPTNCFADDTCTITPPLSLPSAQLLLQSDVDSMSSWTKDHKLTVHPLKTVCMLFHNPRHPSPLLHLHLNNTVISQAKQHKHLGIMFTSTLSWSPYIDYLLSKSSSMLAVLRHLHSIFHFSSESLLKVYLSFIRPALEYASISWSGLSSRDARRLEAFQQKALTLCHSSPSNLPSLSSRRKSRLIRLFSALLSNSDIPPHLLNFCNWPLVDSISVRTASLRNSSAVRLPRPHTSFLSSSPLYKAASAYNASL